MQRTKQNIRKASGAKKEELMDFDQFVNEEPKNNKSWVAIILLVIIVVLVGILLSVYKGDLDKDFKYKAIYLDSNQVYYAKVVREDALSIYLDDVFYIQTQQQTIPPQEEEGEAQVVNVPVLIQRGEEFHKPEGLLQINRDKLIAIEEIGEGSEILLEIERLKGLAE
tara:strand:- start:7 stop:507 length:501 start_codon:yes stop_codon:yes gene_type:complete